MAMKYFHFSKEQLDSRTITEKKLGGTFMPGKVIVKGVEKLYTEMTDASDFRFKDSKIVHQGDTALEIIKFTEPYVD